LHSQTEEINKIGKLYQYLTWTSTALQPYVTICWIPWLEHYT